MDAAVLFVDDGRVAYAYLAIGGRIACGVWLYNHGPAPAKPDWDLSRRQRFVNPASFCKDEPVTPVSGRDELTVSWVNRDGRLAEAVVAIRGQRWACLRPEVKPGFCRLAAQDGPLARVMDDPTGS